MKTSAIAIYRSSNLQAYENLFKLCILKSKVVDSGFWKSMDTHIIWIFLERTFFSLVIPNSSLLTPHSNFLKAQFSLIIISLLTLLILHWSSFISHYLLLHCFFLTVHFLRLIAPLTSMEAVSRCKTIEVDIVSVVNKWNEKVESKYGGYTVDTYTQTWLR